MAIPRPLKTLLERPDATRTLGPFRLIRTLGSGGFAPVWLAAETHGEVELRLAAVKLFALTDSSQASEQRLQILQEAQALCRVEHPNIVRFYALPTDSTLGVMGLAMEYVAGTSLDARLAAEGRLGAQEVVTIGISIASALAAVHRASLVHRDVKPANVVEAGGLHKLIDFGISAADAFPRAGPDVIELDDLPLAPSAALSAALADVAAIRHVSGTLGYVDPAVARGQSPATPSSDLYSLGALLFECTTGRLPAAAGGGEGLDAQVLEGHARPPSVLSLDGMVPPLLARTIDALLDPDPARRPASAEGVASMLHAARLAMGAAPSSLPDEDVGPFRGLGRFEGQDRAVYFGRTTEVARAIDMLRSRGLVALVGASGSGKSSLGRAGVLPAVGEGSLGPWPTRWRTVVMEPGARPRVAFSAALASLGVDASGEPLEVVERLCAAVSARDEGVVLFVDQSEELVTLADEGGRAHFIEALSLLGERAQVGLKIVLGIRRDLLDTVLGLGRLGSTIARGILLLDPLSAASWEGVLDQALGAYGYAFEDDALRAEVLAALATDPGAMPLLQFALGELWRGRDRRRKLLTREAYVALGGISGALGRHADKTLLAIGADRVDTVRRVLLALTTAAGTRRARTHEDLVSADPDARRVTEALEASRIVVRDGPLVTLAHETLLSRWERLRGWVAEAREERALAEDIEVDARRWATARDATLLWRKARLAAGRELAARDSVTLSESARTFLLAGRSEERRGRLAVLVALGALAAVAAIVGAAYVRSLGVEQRKTALALRQEQATREIAERRSEEIQAAQGRIDLLLKELADSPKKEEVLALQDKIRGSASASGPARASRTGAGRGPVTSGNLPPATSSPLALPSPPPATDAAAPAVRVQVDW